MGIYLQVFEFTFPAQKLAHMTQLCKRFWNHNRMANLNILSTSAWSILTEIEKIDNFKAIFQNRNRTEIEFYQSPESS